MAGIIEASKSADTIAKILGIPHGWKLTKMKHGYAAYNAGDRLVFFERKEDFEYE